MIPAGSFIKSAADLGYGPFLGVPCSVLNPLINAAICDPSLTYMTVNNEGEAVAIAAGAYLAGKTPVVLLQNSGLGNTINPLTSLHCTFHIPVLLIISWRGEPGGSDAPQHRLMGSITLNLLKEMGIAYAVLPASSHEIEPVLAESARYIHQQKRPYALIVSKGIIKKNSDSLVSQTEPSHTPAPQSTACYPSPPRLSRFEAIASIVEAAADQALIIATTGKTSRELFAVRDHERHFYMVGSMGCASSVGLGVASTVTDTPVVVIDGDGAALMRLEALVSIGYYHPHNFVHVIIDNQRYASTGGQATLSNGIDFLQLGSACGYAHSVSVTERQDLKTAMANAFSTKGPHLITVKVHPGEPKDIGRPTLSPPEIAARFKKAVFNKRRTDELSTGPK